ncbi:MAG: ROK family transcriptional regulator [Pseudomonadota bacterium]
MNEASSISVIQNGANQKEVRNHNERLILSVLQRARDLPGSEIARQTKLSAQTVSVILRKLEGDGLVKKGKPVKGQVGKPFVPIALNAKGAYSIGFKLGRRSSEACMMRLDGRIIFKDQFQYAVALPDEIFAFVRDCLSAAEDALGEKERSKLCGIGIAAPFEIWKWGVEGGNTPEAFLSWKDISFEREMSRFTDLPIFMVNDATAACWAEHVYGGGRALTNYAYFFVSTFIGGGVVLNRSVYEGARGNAGAFGPLRVGDRAGQTRQLLDIASIHCLESRLTANGYDPAALWERPQDWSRFEALVEDWIIETAHGVAQACVSVCAVIDFEVVVVDGYFPPTIRERLVEAVQAYLPKEDSRGLILPRVQEGQIGAEARARGAATIPVFAQYLLS